MNKYNSDLLGIDRGVCPAETIAPKKTILGKQSSKTKDTFFMTKSEKRSEITTYIAKIPCTDKFR